jgi:hypothetical protein
VIVMLRLLAAALGSLAIIVVMAAPVGAAGPPFPAPIDGR